MAEECSVLLCYAAGKLPPSWDKLSLLTDMSLSSNALSGSLPPRLAAISRLDVSNNQFLCGDIPSTNRGNSTLMSERASLGRQCETIGQAARMSGTLGLILGKPENTFGCCDYDKLRTYTCRGTNNHVCYPSYAKA